LSLSVGIFPYVLKLLQSAAGELRKILVFIWTKILTLDRSCQVDLVKESGHTYFISILENKTIESDQRAMVAFILSVICNNSRPGQSACLAGNTLSICLNQLSESDSTLRRWLLLCLGQLWDSYEDAKVMAIKENAHGKVSIMLQDPKPEVRAAAIFSLGKLIGCEEETTQRKSIEMNIGLSLLSVIEDASPLVRKELLVSFSKLIKQYKSDFKDIAIESFQKEEKLKETQKVVKKTTATKKKN